MLLILDERIALTEPNRGSFTSLSGSREAFKAPTLSSSFHFELLSCRFHNARKDWNPICHLVWNFWQEIWLPNKVVYTWLTAGTLTYWEVSLFYTPHLFSFFFFCSQVFNSACESEVFCCRCFVRDLSVVQLRCKSTPAVLNQSRLSCLCVVISALPPAARSSATVTHMNSTDLKVSSLVIYCPNKPKNK